MSLTQSLILAIQTGELPAAPSELIDHAAKNKILLQYLRRANIEGPIREMQETGYATVMRAAAQVADRLSNLKYALIKFAKPVAYVPADIDLLVAAEDAPSALAEIKGLGYEVVVSEPYCITLEKSTSIDMYLHPCFANVPYMDGRKLLEYVIEQDLNEVRVKVLAPAAEAALTAAHALYKEQEFTLNDYFTIRSWFSSDAVMVARKTKTEASLSLAVSMAERIEKGQLEAPCKINLPTALALGISKLACDSFARSSTPMATRKFKDTRLGAHLRSRLMRETY